jgi:hypothetical protein
VPKFFAEFPERKIIRGETCPKVINALFWVITQRIVEIPYRCFGTTYRSQPQGRGKVHLEDEIDILSLNVGKELPLLSALYP